MTSSLTIDYPYRSPYISALRSLQRRLKEQGMSSTQLLESTRKKLGVQYVRDPQHSFNEIGFLLGFAEPGNFSRAFKRWYGKSPSRYRQDSLF